MTEDYLREEIQDWINWSRENIAPMDDLPLTGNSEIDPPWRDSALDFYRRYQVGSGFNEVSILSRLFESELAKNPTDAAIRFTALDLFSELVRIKDYYVGEDPSSFCENCQGLFDYIVRLLPVEAADTWRSIKWEIPNACAAQDWENARRLYDRAYDLGLFDKTHIQLLRGHFHFLVAFHKALESTINELLQEALEEPVRIGLSLWKPDVVFQAFLSQLISFHIQDHLVDTDYNDIRMDDSNRTSIRRAVADLENGLANKPQASMYRSILAMCYFAIEDYANAAKQYQLLIDIRQQDLPPEGMLKALAECYRLAGQYDKARTVLEECLRLFPGKQGFYSQLAYLYVEKGDYVQACEYFRAENEIDKTFGEDPHVSVALALGGILDGRDSQGIIATLVADLWKNRPEVHDLIDSMYKEYWATYRLLCEPAREQWLTGTTLGNYLAVQEPKQKQLLLSKADASFATAVEIELKERVFSKFRKAIHEGTGHRETPGEEKTRSRIVSKFREIVLDPNREIRLTLGEMYEILDQSRTAKDSLIRDFYAWVSSKHGRLLKEIRLLGEINKVRGKAVHPSTVPVEGANSLSGKCRKFLDALLNNSAK